MSRGTKTKVRCATCCKAFLTRTADVDRGWGKFCSKSCKANHKETMNISLTAEEISTIYFILKNRTNGNCYSQDENVLREKLINSGNIVKAGTTYISYLTLKPYIDDDTKEIDFQDTSDKDIRKYILDQRWRKRSGIDPDLELTEEQLLIRKMALGF